MFVHCLTRLYNALTLLPGVYRHRPNVDRYVSFRFVSSFSQAMASAPHLYLSALSWLPTGSCLRKVVELTFQAHAIVNDGLQQDWNAALWISNTGDEVRSAACSADGCRIAVGTGNDVHVLDAVTGQVAGEPLRGHTGAVTSVTFSRDGSRIASSSCDHSIRL